MFSIRLLAIVSLLGTANANLMTIDEDSDWQSNMLLARAVSSIIYDFYAKISPAVCIVRAATSSEAYADQSSIISNVLKDNSGPASDSHSAISFRIDNYNKVFSIMKLRFHNIFFIDNYNGFR